MRIKFLTETLSLLCIIFMVTFSACTKTDSCLYVSYIDTNGKLIEYCVKDNDYNPEQKALPSDTEDWHYTGWNITEDGNNITCVATRVAIHKYFWKDRDDNIIFEEIIYGESKPPQKDLPTGNEKWAYTAWEEETVNNTTTYYTTKLPNSNYLLGNVFQIVVKNKRNEPVSTGSGFVINEDGLFITNHHVMDGAYSADAYFDIIDTADGSRYTKLKIIGSVYDDANKDIYIGKLNNYEKIKNYYKPIGFTEKYKKEQKVYSVGYPNSSVTMEINSGTILEEYSDIYSKVNNVFYVLSDSYIAPGSSGGILLDKNYEIIGITTIGLYADENKTIYIAGGSIPTFVFKNQINNLNENNLLPLNQ